LIEKNPLDRLPYPADSSVRRPVLVAEMFDRMVTVAPRVSALCPLLLSIVHETGHRVGAVLQLRWSDLDLDHALIRWRAETDKLRSAHETPLSEVAADRLRKARRERSSLGDGWVFPAPGNAASAVTRHRARFWWNRMEELAGVDPEAGRG
jgi:integrase